MSEGNPYSTPLSEPTPKVSVPVEHQSLGTIARVTFLAWEKLRLVYIGILGALTLLMGLMGGISALIAFEFWGTVIMGAVVANLCYFAGPIIETYVTWLGYRGKWLRIVLFCVGTLFSCILAIGAIGTVLLPGMD